MTTTPLASDLNLKISFDSARPKVKIYDSVPELGIIKGYGVDREDRSSLVEALEVLNWHRRDGVYLLFKQMAINYVGITQNVSDRLNEHSHKRKDDQGWDRVIVFYATRQLLNANITGFAEYTLYLHLKRAGFLLLQDPPAERLLNPDDQKIARQLVIEIERMLDLLDLSRPSANQPLGATHIKDATVTTNGGPTTSAQNDVEQDVAALRGLDASNQRGIDVVLNAQGAKARGKYTSFGLEVYAGSRGTSVVKPHMQDNQSYWRMRNQLKNDEVIRVEGDKLLFLQPYTFASPTAAANILCGSNAPGPLRWKRASDGTPLVKVKQQAE